MVFYTWSRNPSMTRGALQQIEVIARRAPCLVA